MTPNPHPASANGDVIERAVESGAKVIAASPLIDDPQLEWPSWMGLSRAVLDASGLLKLSEGSGDGKLREALERIRDLPRTTAPIGCENCQAHCNDADEMGQIATETLAATPTPSPKCRGKYCWNAGDPDGTGSFSRCEECPDRPVDAEGMREDSRSINENEIFVLDNEHVVCFGGRFHGWKFWRHPDGNLVSVEKLEQIDPPPSPLQDALAQTICRSGKFETGEGTCAFACMDQLGDCRKAGCKHATAVHGKLADAILSLIGGRHG